MNLSPRQQQVATMFAGGNTRAQIARTLGIAEATVKNHLHSARQRTLASNRETLAQALGVAYAKPRLPNLYRPRTWCSL